MASTSYMSGSSCYYNKKNYLPYLTTTSTVTTWKDPYKMEEKLTRDVEEQRDSLFLLRKELASKNKEISLLKVKAQQKENELTKTLKTIENILKNCDHSTKTGCSLISQQIEKEYNSNNTNNNDNTCSNNNNTDNTEQSVVDCNNNNNNINDLLHFTPEQQHQLVELVTLHSLRKQTSLQERKLREQTNCLGKIHSTLNYQTVSKLEKNYTLNKIELDEAIKEHQYIINTNENLKNDYDKLSKENEMLNKELQIYKQQYFNYKQETDNEIKQNEMKYEQAKQKERTCLIFHHNINNNNECDNNNNNKQAQMKITELNSKVQQLERELDNNKKANQHNEITNEMRFQKEYEEVNKENDKIKERIDVLNKERELKENMIRDKDGRIAQLEDMVSDINKGKEKELQWQREEEEKVRKMESELNELQNKSRELNGRNRELEKELKCKENEYIEKMNRNDKLKKEYEELKRMYEELVEEKEKEKMKEQFFATQVNVVKRRNDEDDKNDEVIEKEESNKEDENELVEKEKSVDDKEKENDKRKA